jgi:D-galactarolactone cycloisomerase
VTLPPLPAAPVHPARVDAFVFRAPIASPVKTSFGVMHDRPAVFVRVEDRDGASGWGEVWCNFPSCGAEHRVRLVDSVISPLLLHRDWSSPAHAFAHLEERTAVLAIQSGEPGPLAQAIAGVDLALWDLCARRAGVPLRRLLGGTRDRIKVYASGINPDRPQETVARSKAGGYRAFKLKVGFDAAQDIANLESLRALLGDDTPLMADANQGWSLQEALDIVPRLRAFGLGWLEEPLRADRPWQEWKLLASAASMPLAAGENLLGSRAFGDAMAHSPLSVLQPDLAKWGGISGCWPVIAEARRRGFRYCPHFLGGGIGLLHSAHVLAAAGGDGMLEIDANPNPLRTLLSPELVAVDDGWCTLGELPGIGIDPDVHALAAQLPALA